jgi:hypothetical protein
LLKGTKEIKLPDTIKKEIFTMEEIFIKTSVGDSNVLRKVGKNDSFTYSHEMRYEINGEKI